MAIIRFFRWGIERLGVSTFLSFCLLFMVFWSLISALSDSIREFDTILALPVVTIGVLLGWGLARLALPAWLAGLMALILGVEAIVIRVGRLDKMLIDLVRALPPLAWEVWQWPLMGQPDFEPAQSALLSIAGGLYIMFIRLFGWLGSLLAANNSMFDPVAATLTWNFVLWGVAVWAGWVVRRRAHPFLAVTPAGALLAGVLAHSAEWPGAIIYFLAATLLLMALIKHHAREVQWQQRGVSFSPEIRVDLAMAVVPLSVGLVAVAALFSAISVDGLTTFVQNMIWGRPPVGTSLVADSLGLDQGAGVSTALDPIRFGGLPRKHLIGSGPELSEQVVMVIETNDPPLGPDEAPPPYYWRSITYDRYTGRGWATGNTQRMGYQADAATVAETPVRRRVVQQRVQGLEYASNLLHVAGEVMTVDQPYDIDWRGPDDIFGATIDAATYRAKSHIASFTEDELRQAGNDYPEWIQARYLFLPETVPGRVKSLARDLTATAATPYDRAKAIESYLRAFPYNLDLPTPPQNRDIADYFLFDLKQGYCDYYATSMVALARAAGLPARLAVGYARGAYNAEENLYIITEADAHSWVEIYFPEFGWVNFEPTGGRPGIDRGSGADSALGSADYEEPWDFPSGFGGDGSPVEATSGLPAWLTWASSGLFLVLFSFIGWNIVDHWRLRRLTPAATVATLHHRLYRHGRRLKTPPATSDTPYEFATELSDRLTNLTTKNGWRGYLTPAVQEVRWLTHLYVRTLYSPHHFDMTDQTQAIKLWQRLRRRLWLAWLVVFSKRN